MSVDYEAALMYGVKCEPSAWDCEDREYMEDKGWDVIYDWYSDKFLYIGKILSHACLGEEVQHEVPTSNVLDLVGMGADIIMDVPDHLLESIGDGIAQLYHLCYAT